MSDHEVIPDAGAKDVTDAMVWAFADAHGGAGASDRLQDPDVGLIKHSLRAALAVMPRRDKRAGMRDWRPESETSACGQLAWLQNQGDTFKALIGYVADLEQRFEALRTPTPEQPRDDGWQLRPHLRPDGIATRCDHSLLSPAEKAIVSAMTAVEAAGASRALTDAVVLLQRARDRVADHVEGDQS